MWVDRDVLSVAVENRFQEPCGIYENFSNEQHKAHVDQLINVVHLVVLSTLLNFARCTVQLANPCDRRGWAHVQ